MKKLESSLLNMTVVLTVISVIAGGLLAYVNGVTEGPIREIKKKALADGIKSVLQANEAIVQQIDTIDGGLAIVYKTDKMATQVTDVSILTLPIEKGYNFFFLKKKEGGANEKNFNCFE